MPENSHIILYFFPHPHPYILANPFTWPGDFPSSLVTRLKFFFWISGSRKPVNIFNPQNNVFDVFFFHRGSSSTDCWDSESVQLLTHNRWCHCHGKGTVYISLARLLWRPFCREKCLHTHFGILEKWSQLELFAYEHELS